MARKIRIISEGLVDEALLPPLLDCIARSRADQEWPVFPMDIDEPVLLRRRGHGGVLKKVEWYINNFASIPSRDDAFFVILLDRKTKAVQSEIKQLIGGRSEFVMGVAIEEIEAWWLADKRNLFEFLGISQDQCSKTRYGKSGYKHEKDDNPKLTLHELTLLSPTRTDTYGGGNAEIARDFAERFWTGRVDLDAIKQKCPEGFQPFCREVLNAVSQELARRKTGPV